MGELQLDLDTLVLEQMIELIYHHTGISMTGKKENLIRARLRPRMRVLGLTSFKEYIAHLESDKNEKEVFVNLLTTNETTFFRTPRIWEYFIKEFLMGWKESNSNVCLNIWSAAASSGEEAYSIAISCFEQGITKFNILGTDISTEVLGLAQRGIYSGRNSLELNKKFPALLNKYFHQKNEIIEAKDILKEHVTFKSHNLFRPLNSRDKFDIVFLRNVLIYFKNEDQVKVLNNISANLKKGGILILGESESISRLETNFQYKSPLIYTNG